jgi:Tol biopolymer transport system component
VPVLEGAWVKPGGAMPLAVSRNGTLAYLAASSDARLVLDGPDGPRALFADRRTLANPRFSPDGRRIALDLAPTRASRGSDERRTTGRGRDIWVYDVGDSTLTRITAEGDNHAPEWSPDGRWLLFTTWGTRPGETEPSSQLRRVPAAGGVPPELVFRHEENAQDATWTPDGRAILFLVNGGRATAWDVWTLPLEGSQADRTARALLRTPFRETMPAVSPDGRWLAYVSDESGRPELYVRAFPSMAARRQLSSNGAAEPAWSRDGRSLTYWEGDRLIRVSLDVGDAVAVRDRRVVAQDATYGAGGHETHRFYDVHPDGVRRVAARVAAADTKLYVVVNWLDEAKRKVAGTTP